MWRMNGVFILLYFFLLVMDLKKKKKGQLKIIKQPEAKHGCRHNCHGENCLVIYLGFCAS